MPSVSGPQHRAMEAAAHGDSTLGIPKSVGQEFARADSSLGAHTGMGGGKKKPARHPGRGRGDPKAHHENMGKALDAGDHEGARKHAFAFVRSLGHGKASPDLGPKGVQPMPAAPSTAAVPPQKPAPGPNVSRLVSALKTRKV